MGYDTGSAQDPILWHYSRNNLRRSKMRNLTITICGCGNGAHACAAQLSIQGHTVNMYSPISEEVARFKDAYAKNGGLTMRFGGELHTCLSSENPTYSENVETVEHIRINKITDNAAEVIPGASVIFIIVPAFAHKNVLKHIKPYLDKNSLIVFTPSRSGVEFEINSILPGANVIAFQTLPWATRIKKFGSEIFIFARKESILAASMPGDISDVFFSQMEQLLLMKIIRAKHIFTISLANVGQILHPTITYSVFKNDPKKVYTLDNLPLFYGGINEEGAERLSRVSDEIREIAVAAAKINPDIEVDRVLHLRDWLNLSYSNQIEDKSSLYKMIITNPAYKGSMAPVKKIGEGKYIPDFTTRYIVEDVPYGMLVVKSIAMMVDVKTPAIDEVLTGIDDWTGNNYLGRMKGAKTLSSTSRLPEIYGVSNAQELFGSR